MADEKPAPTEEQVKAANEAEEAKWQDDFKEEELSVPYKREEPKEEKAPEANTKEEKEVEPDDTPEEPRVQRVEDPGEYKPADHSFEVTLKDGKTHKVTTPEEAEKLADDPDNFETPKQLMDFLTKSNKMQRQLDRDYESWESKHKAFTDQEETEKQRQADTQNIANGISYLVKKGKLPKIDSQYLNANWKDPEVAKQPGVKEQIELLRYMVKENGIREKAGLPPFASIVDAYAAWMGERKESQEETDRKAAGEARKSAGSKVAGVSPSSQGVYVPKGIAVGNPNVFKRGAAVWDN